MGLIEIVGIIVGAIILGLIITTIAILKSIKKEE